MMKVSRGCSCNSCCAIAGFLRCTVVIPPCSEAVCASPGQEPMVLHSLPCIKECCKQSVLNTAGQAMRSGLPWGSRHRVHASAPPDVGVPQARHIDLQFLILPAHMKEARVAHAGLMRALATRMLQPHAPGGVRASVRLQLGHAVADQLHQHLKVCRIQARTITIVATVHARSR